MSPKERRTTTLLEAERLGYQIPETLPLSEPSDEYFVRPIREVADKALILNCVIASSFGLKKETARNWLHQFNLQQLLTPEEKEFLDKSNPTQKEINYFRLQVEGLWILTWALCFVSILDFGSLCGENLVKLLPDLKKEDSPDFFYSKAKLRTKEELLCHEDLAYCLHWVVRQAQLEGVPIPGKIPPYVIEERRRALMWILSNEEWHEITLDT